MCSEYDKQDCEAIEVQTQSEDWIHEYKESIPPDLALDAAETVKAAASCCQKFIDSADRANDIASQANNDIDKRIVEKYLDMMDRSDLSKEEKEQLRAEVRYTQEKMDARTTSVRKSGDARIKEFFNLLGKTAFVVGGVYALKLLLKFLKEIVIETTKA